MQTGSARQLTLLLQRVTAQPDAGQNSSMHACTESKRVRKIQKKMFTTGMSCRSFQIAKDDNKGESGGRRCKNTGVVCHLSIDTKSKVLQR